MATSNRSSFGNAIPRERCLIVLPDRGSSKRLSTADFGIKARDQSWNAYLNSFLRANERYLRALDIKIEFGASLDEVEVKVRANGIIGAAPLRAPDTHQIIGGIVVRPRYGWNSVGKLLSQIGWNACPEVMPFPLVPGSAKEIPPWVIAGPAIFRLETLLKNNIPRFCDKSEIRQIPRGRIDWEEYCTRQFSSGNMHQFPCQFPDLDVDQNVLGYIRWSLEKIKVGLAPFNTSDLVARKLSERANLLISSLHSAKIKIPTHRELENMDRLLQRQVGTSSSQGIEAIRWILDERGLAGTVETDGLAWRLTMHELFEMWLEQIVRDWGKQFG